MYAWILGSRFRRVVAGNRGVYADDEEGRIGPLNPCYINGHCRHPRDESENKSDDWRKQTTCGVRSRVNGNVGLCLWGEICGAERGVAASSFPGFWKWKS